MPEHPSTPLVPIPDDDRGLLAECRVDTFRAGGKGGQHQNATESGVRLTHLPTGTSVTSRQERSQHRNRQIALGRLRRRLEQRNARKRRRIKTRVPARERRRRLEEKRTRSQTKASRRKPRLDGPE
ncbi:MAG: peptide chain release factor-like protein [Gemmatimonadota bacterium]|nr:MAG: peptide chain release factor-like protein [Gemmatimonadota bacterium]